MEAMVIAMQHRTASADFWCGKRVLLTGHTGFKGGWLTLWLQQLGADVTGLSLPPITSPTLFELANIADGVDSHFCDVRDEQATASIIRAAQPEIVFHLAAQPLVRASYSRPVETFASNIMGTAHVLNALRSLESVKVAVVVTTDKVYSNNESPWPYREVDALGGYDPYSASKAASEIVICSYRNAFLKAQGIAVASARAGNVIGGGDWSEDRLIPDAVRAWGSNETLEIRCPNAIRPWQHVLEPLHGYLSLAEQLWSNASLAGAYNFGPHTHEAATVREVIELARGYFGKGDVSYGCSTDGSHEAALLLLEIAKARTVLGFSPRWNLRESVRRTMSWYCNFQSGGNIRSLCERELAEYTGT